MTSARIAKHDNIGYFENLDVKSPFTEDIVYNEAVMRGAFVQFLRRLADQVENGLIPLFDAMTFSPYNTISSNEDISHTNNTFKASPPPPPPTPKRVPPQSSSQPSLAPLLPATHEEIQLHSGCHSVLQHHQERNVFHQPPPPLPQQQQQRKLDQQQRQQHCDQQHLQLQLSHHMSEVNDINLDDDDDDDDDNGDTNDNVIDDDEDRYSNDIIVEPAYSSESENVNNSGQLKQETSFDFNSQLNQDLYVGFPEQSVKHQMVPLLSVVNTDGSDTYPDILVDKVRLQVLMDRVVNAKRPSSPVSMHYFSLSILQGAINLVFSKWELKHSSGLGLRRTKTESGQPLDRRKVDAIEMFYMSLCDEYNLTEVTKAVFHKAFTIKISNAKRDYRKS